MKYDPHAKNQLYFSFTPEEIEKIIDALESLKLRFEPQMEPIDKQIEKLTDLLQDHEDTQAALDE